MIVSANIAKSAGAYRSESSAVKCKAASALANLATADSELIRSKIDSKALVFSAQFTEARGQVLRCMFNLSNDENSVDWLMQASPLRPYSFTVQSMYCLVLLCFVMPSLHRIHLSTISNSERKLIFPQA